MDRHRVAVHPFGGGQRGRAAGLAPHRLGHRVRDPEQVLLGRAVYVAVVARLALHDAHAYAALPAALGTLDTAVVEREREAAPRLGVQLSEVAAASQRALEDARREVGGDERHDSFGRLARRARGLRGLAESGLAVELVLALVVRLRLAFAAPLARLAGFPAALAVPAPDAFEARALVGFARSLFALGRRDGAGSSDRPHARRGLPSWAASVTISSAISSIRS